MGGVATLPLASYGELLLPARAEGGREGRWRRGKSMAERSVELELYQEEGGDILTNTTTKVSKEISLRPVRPLAYSFNR